MAADAELCVALKRSRYLKLAANSGKSGLLAPLLGFGGSAVKAVAPSLATGGASAAVEGMAGGDAAEATTAFAGGAVLGGLGTVGRRLTRSRAQNLGARSTAAIDRYNAEGARLSQPVPKAVTEPAPVKPDFDNPSTITDAQLRQRVEAHHASTAPGAQPVFSRGDLTDPALKAQYDAHVKAVADANAAVTGFKPKPYVDPVTGGAVRDPGALMDPSHPDYKATSEAYQNARAKDLEILQNYANDRGLSTDDFLKFVNSKAGGAIRTKLHADLIKNNEAFKQAPRPVATLSDRLRRPAADWEARALDAGKEFPSALQSRHDYDTQAFKNFQAAAQADEAGQRATVSQAHADALAKQQQFEQSNLPQTMNPAVLAAKRLALQNEIDAAHQAASDAVTTKNTAAQKAEADATTTQNDDITKLQAGRPAVQTALDKAQAAERLRKGTAATSVVAPVVGGAYAGAVPALKPVGERLNRTAARVGNKALDAVTPGSSFTELAAKYIPAVAGIGAVAALAYLLSKDDDEDEPQRKHAMEPLGTSAKRKLTRLLTVNPGLATTLSTLPKLGAVADDDHVARAARNRRRIQGLLARNPKALDNIDHDGALHALPIQLDATKLAALLQ